MAPLDLLRKEQEFMLMKNEFTGKKVFFIGSAPDPKINYELVKDHIWVTTKGSGWCIENVWGLDRVPDYNFFTGHHVKRFTDEMYKQIKCKNFVYLVPTNTLWDNKIPFWYEKNDEFNREKLEKQFRDLGCQFDNFYVMHIVDTAEGYRRLVETQYFVKNGKYFGENISIGTGMIAYFLLCGAEEVVISGMSIEKIKHSYSDRGLNVRQNPNRHAGEDMATYTILLKTGHNIKTFEPELYRRVRMPLLG